MFSVVGHVTIPSTRVKRANQILQQHLKINSTALTRRSWKLSTSSLAEHTRFIRASAYSLIEKASTGSRSCPRFSILSSRVKKSLGRKRVIRLANDASTKADTNVGCRQRRKKKKSIMTRSVKFERARGKIFIQLEFCYLGNFLS